MTNLVELAASVKETWKPRLSPEEVKQLLRSLAPVEQAGRSDIIEMAYPRLDLGFLKQRQASRFPKFAVFCMESPWCSFFAGSNNATYRHSLFEQERKNAGASQRDLAGYLSRQYFSDMFDFLVEEAKRRTNFFNTIYVSARQKFNGLLPEHVREDIALVEATLGGPIVVIADAGEWVINETRQSGYDPLVVKFDNEDYSSAFLISAFDVSTAEEMAAREFSTGNVSHIIDGGK